MAFSLIVPEFLLSVADCNCMIRMIQTWRKQTMLCWHWHSCKLFESADWEKLLNSKLLIKNFITNGISVPKWKQFHWNSWWKSKAETLQRLFFSWGFCCCWGSVVVVVGVKISPLESLSLRDESSWCSLLVNVLSNSESNPTNNLNQIFKYNWHWLRLLQPRGSRKQLVLATRLALAMMWRSLIFS